eukprot:14679080-Alexandrium_andersonii.AAC.1
MTLGGSRGWRCQSSPRDDRGGTNNPPKQSRSEAQLPVGARTFVHAQAQLEQILAHQIQPW